MTPGASERLAVVGLGYVGLPLAAAFGRQVSTMGFDIDEQRVQELCDGYDRNGEVSKKELETCRLHLTADPSDLRRADFIIVAVPTPVDEAKRPDTSHLVEASLLVGEALKSRAAHKPSDGDSGVASKPIVVFESTVYPGCTEETCIPQLEKSSGLTAGRDFKVGYSPERVNPGDSQRALDNVVKVVAAQDTETVEVMEQVYGLVAKAGTYRAPDIRTAEAAKVIENVQRDLNIALMNELAMLFGRMGLDTREVIRAAQTKWNFLPFEPGLVGGHCIPVDPYYLTHKAQEVGYHSEIILAGRRINDAMGAYVAQTTVKLLARSGKAVGDTSILVLGSAFKENVRDVRNSLAVDLVRELASYGARVQVHDPLVGSNTLKQLGLDVVSDPFSDGAGGARGLYDAVVLAVPHRSFTEMRPESYRTLMRDDGTLGVLVDVKGVMPSEWVREHSSDFLYWRL